MKAVRYWVAGLLGVGMLISLYLDFVWSPAEARMGDVVRIMYFHIASALVGFLSFGITALAAFIFLLLRWKGKTALATVFDRISYCSAQLGVLFTTFVLVTGSLWGAAVWNTWWTWDPTLTTTLILWFLYVGYLLLRSSIGDRGRAQVVSGVYGIIAAVDVPLIHISVTWWSGLHPMVITDAGFNMPPSMVVTLLFSFLVFIILYGMLLWIVYDLNRDQSELQALRERMRSTIALLGERE